MSLDITACNLETNICQNGQLKTQVEINFQMEFKIDAEYNL